MKRILTLIAVLICLSVCIVPLHAEESNQDDPLHMDTEYGIIDYVRSVTDGNIFYIVFDYTNTTNQATMPIMQYDVKAYQNGISMTDWYMMSPPEDCNLGTQYVQPGATIRYVESFKLSDKSVVEVTISPLMDFIKKRSVSCKITVADGDPDPSETVKEETSTQSLSETSNQAELDAANARIEELESQLEEANKTIAELQSQIDTIKSALGA